MEDFETHRISVMLADLIPTTPYLRTEQVESLVKSFKLEMFSALEVIAVTTLPPDVEARLKIKQSSYVIVNGHNVCYVANVLFGIKKADVFFVPPHEAVTPYMISDLSTLRNKNINSLEDYALKNRIIPEQLYCWMLENEEYVDSTASLN